MALLCASPIMTKFVSLPLSPSFSSRKSTLKPWVCPTRRIGVGFKAQAFFIPFDDQPIVKDALKEPVAFVGGMFAGLLRLDLNEDPLKEWIARTAEASGIKPEEVVDGEESRLDGKEESPQQIEIE